MTSLNFDLISQAQTEDIKFLTPTQSKCQVRRKAQPTKRSCDRAGWSSLSHASEAVIDEYGAVMGKNDELLAKTGDLGGKSTKLQLRCPQILHESSSYRT
jgi:hypothetical protein